MRIEEFDYPLPKPLIAQFPPSQRGESRLMVLHRDRGEIEHRAYRDISDYFFPGDLLVVNNTRVLPARLIGTKETGGKCELLFIPSWNGAEGEWEVLIKGSRKVREGTRIEFGQGICGEVRGVKNGRGKVRLFDHGEIMDLLQKMGHIPLPPYIKRNDVPLDRDRYQTIFADRDGSIAAPTAGLHFTEPMLRAVREKGADIASITLHIGVGTFTPVKTKQVEDHEMAAEWVEISEETAREVERTKEREGKVIAAGTTTTRALESFSTGAGGVKPDKGMTPLFIYPPYHFRVIDGLITNFHLPKSTLIMLVSAFAGKDLLMRAYREAIDQNYRFYSYGDAMLIL